MKVVDEQEQILWVLKNKTRTNFVGLKKKKQLFTGLKKKKQQFEEEAVVVLVVYTTFLGVFFGKKKKEKVYVGVLKKPQHIMCYMLQFFENRNIYPFFFFLVFHFILCCVF